ncbi:MAG: hypothetical protein CL916_01525 [Deltaproteobacteria bacterium]|nr:hypothetical protein [Deltaproteobacteria bacterium]
MFILFLSSTYISCTETSKTQEPAPPEFSSPDMIQPREPLPGDIVRCIPLAFDPNQDPLSYSYQWTDQDGSIVSESLEFQLGEDFEPLKSISCTVVASNDLGEEVAQTDSVFVKNTNPEITSLTITPYSDITVLSELECSVQGGDPDGFLVESSYIWMIDGEEVGTDSVLQLSSDIAYDGARVSCLATLQDPHEGSVQEQVDVVLGNYIPHIESISFSDESVYGYTPVSCLVSVFDGDEDEVSIRYKWTLDGIIQQQHDSEFDLSILPGGRFPAGGNLSCTATPYDDIGYGEAQTISTIILNEEPVISDIRITPEEPFANSTVLCSSTATDPDLRPVSITYSWLVDGEEVSSESYFSLSPSLISPNETLSCLVTVIDEQGAQTQQETSVLVQDSNPEIISVEIQPSIEPTVGTTLSCIASASDINNDPLTYTYSWSNEQGVVLGNEDTLLLTNDNTDPFESIHCSVVVTPSTTIVSSSQSIVIGNVSPTIDSVLLTPDSPTVDSVFECTIQGAFDQEEQSLVEEFRWYHNEVLQVETSAFFTPSQLAVTDKVRCSARVLDGFTTSDWLDTLVVVQNQDPVIDSVSITPTGTIFASDVLTCSYVATDPDDNALEVSYSWTNNEQEVVSTDSILPLDPTTNNPDDVFTCTVTVTDIHNGTANSSDQILITNSTPYFLQPAQLTSGLSSAFMGEILTCSATAFDLDQVLLDIEYRWEDPDGNLLDTGDTFELSQSNVGSLSEISCVAVATDEENSSFSSSLPIQIINSLPEISGVSLSPEEPKSTDTLVCSVGEITDADMDSVTISYSWKIDDVVQNESTDTLAGPFSVGNEVSCLATPADADGYGESVESVVIIQNSDPVIANVTISPQVVNVNSVVTCISTVSDVDDETLIISLAWTKEDGTVLSQESELDLAHEDINTEDLTCTVTVEDESGSVVTGYSSVALQNTAPEWTSQARISKPNGAVSTQTLTCFAEANDLDEGALTVEYSWSNDAGVVLSTTDELLLDPALTNVGDVLTCTATASDSGQETISSSASEVLINSSPEVVVEIPEGVYQAGDTIPCSVLGTDIDDQQVSFSYEWTIDGAVQTETSNSFQGSFTRGNEVTCTVTPNDGISDGSAISASVDVTNTPPTITSIDFVDASLYTNETADVTTVIADVDSDSVTVTYSWYVDANLVQVGTSNTLDGAVYFDKDQEIYVEVDVTDGYEEGDSSSSSTITILNTPPVAPTVSISPDVPSIFQQDINCDIDIDAVDVDGDVLSYQYFWYREGQFFLPTLNNAQVEIVDAEEVDEPGLWECFVTVTDEDGASSTSNTASTNVEKQGETSDSAAPNCQSIQDSGYFGDSTSYWLNPDGGTPFATMCDFDVDGGGWMLAFSSPASDTTMGSAWDYWYTAGGTTDLDTDVSGKSEAFDRIEATEIRLTATEGSSEIRADLGSSASTLLSLTGAEPFSCSGLQGVGRHQFSSTFRTGSYFPNDSISIVVCDVDGTGVEAGTHYDLAVFSTNLSHDDYSGSIGDIGSEDRVGGALSTTSASSGNILSVWVR